MLDRPIGRHEADKGVRRLPTKDMLPTLLFAQVSGARSLRDIEAILESQDACRYRLGLRQVKCSALADAAAVRPAGVFTGLFSASIPRVTRNCAALFRSNSRFNFLLVGPDFVSSSQASR